MMKEAVRALETGAFAEIGLIAFVVAFMLIVAYTFTLSKEKRDEAKHLPLDSLPRWSGDAFEAHPDHVQNGHVQNGHVQNGTHA